MNEIWTLLNTHIHPLQTPAQWLPIVALVYLVNELESLVLQVPKQLKLIRQQCPQQLQKIYVASIWRRVLLWVLLSQVAWYLFWSLFFI